MNLILGVTASGKGAVAFELAKRIGGEIISIDSMKVYRRMDIGTAKPSVERRGAIRHHIIDVIEPSDSFSVDQFLKHTDGAMRQIVETGKEAVAVGGTALYIKALLYGIFDGPPADFGIRKRLKTESTEALHRRLGEVDPGASSRIHPNDLRRIIRALEVYELTGKPISSFQTQFGSEPMRRDWRLIGLRRSKQSENGRINRRAKRMIEEGLVEEVKALLAEERPLSKQAACAIGYAEIIQYLNGRGTLEEAVERIKVNSRRLAKAQRTWFKTFHEVNWLDVEEDEEAGSVVDRIMAMGEAGSS